MRQNRPHLGRLRGKHDEREEAFLIAFYAEDSETKGNKCQSALVAGYAETTAEHESTKIIKKYSYRKFQEALAAVGINNLMMGMRVRQMIEKGNDKDALGAIRLTLANKGEITDEKGGNVNINAPNAPIMVIVGATGERLRALRSGEPQLSREQQEQLSEGRGAERLLELKRKNRSIDKATIGRCQYWNIRRGKPCTCGMHVEAKHEEEIKKEIEYGEIMEKRNDTIEINTPKE